MIWRCAGDFFKVLLECKMAATDQLLFFEGRKNCDNLSGQFPYTSYFLVGAKTEKLKSVIIHIVQSHYPPSGKFYVQVILLKFKMATTNRLFKYLWPQKV